ncbi:MAG: DUF2905 domain-containing protein [Candidatus Bathyarchaeota archaeon]
MKIYEPTTILGLILIISGILLVLLPLIAQHIPSLDKIPWILIWTYKTDNFVFVTSPLLIIITLISLIINYVKH